MVKKALKAVLATLLTLLVVAVFYLAVILGQPQENPDAVVISTDQPVLTASPAVTLSSAEQLESMLQAFPVSALYAADSSSLSLSGGTSYDMAYEDGFARILTLSYTTEAGTRVEVQSIYPARALDFVPKGDYHIGQVAGQSIAGLESVRMENGQSIRLHVQAAEGIYVLTVPTMTADELASVTRALQLYVDPQEETP